MKKHEILIHYISLQCNCLALRNIRLSLIEVNNVNRMPRCCYLSKTNALSYQVNHIRLPNLALFTGESLSKDNWILWRLDYWICFFASFFVILGTSYVRWHRFVKVSREVGKCLWPLLWHVSQSDFRRLSVFNRFWQARGANFCRTSKYNEISIHLNDSSQNWLRHLHQAMYIKTSLYQNVFCSSKVHLADRTTSRSFFFSSLAAAAFSSSFTQPCKPRTTASPA